MAKPCEWGKILRKLRIKTFVAVAKSYKAQGKSMKTRQKSSLTNYVQNGVGNPPNAILSTLPIKTEPGCSSAKIKWFIGHPRNFEFKLVQKKRKSKYFKSSVRPRIVIPNSNPTLKLLTQDFMVSVYSFLTYNKVIVMTEQKSYF